MVALRDYQHMAVTYLHARRNAALWADMGLGKTAIVLTALTPEYLPALVVAPKRVAENVWQEERDKWRPDLTMALAVGTPKERSIALHRHTDVTVVAIEFMRELMEARPAVPWKTLILDESSQFKSRGVRYKIARKMLYGSAASIEHCWQMTGTPTPNGLEDLWTQIFLLDKGKRLGTTLGGFRERFFTQGKRMPNGHIYGRVPRKGMDEKIHRKLEDICLSLSAEGRVEMPPVTYNEVNVTLPPKVVQVYKAIKEDLIADMSIFKGSVLTVKNTGILTGKLVQLTAGFVYGDDHDIDPADVIRVHQEKTKAATEIVEGTGSPVIVFYQLREELAMLQAALPQARTMNEPDLQKRWNAGEIPVLLAHPAGMAHGLNLQFGGHTIIWTTLPWSLEQWQQGNKRLIRPGQEHPVMIHVIMARSPTGARTVDHLIRTRLDGKHITQAALLEHLEGPI